MCDRYLRLMIMVAIMVVLTLRVAAQEVVQPVPRDVQMQAVPQALAHREHVGDSVKVGLTTADSTATHPDSVIISQEQIEAIADSTQKSMVVISDQKPPEAEHDSIKQKWVPDSKKAMWLAIAIPGGGQIYNRKYWKLPIIYGGFIGCVYALRWNDTMYSDYSQAYIDIMDDDPNTKSYEDFLPIGYDVKANEERLKELFKRKKNYYRRYRDMSMFCMIGVYALSILDAFVDAELSGFDIDRDLTLKVRPTVISSHDNLASRVSMMPNSYGVRCSLEF